MREEDANAEVPWDLDTFNSMIRNIIYIVVKHGEGGNPQYSDREQFILFLQLQQKIQHLGDGTNNIIQSGRG